MKKLLIIALLFWGCALNPTSDPNYVSPEEQWNTLRQHFIGKHYSEIIQILGAYTRESEDGLGGRILIWETHTPEKTTQRTNPFWTIKDPPEELYFTSKKNAKTEKTQIFCDSKGIIYNMKYDVY